MDEMDPWYERIGRYPTGLPTGTVRRYEPRFGFSIEVPGRFLPWPGTLDPVAEVMREPVFKAGEDAGDPLSWPLGYRDPQVIVRDAVGYPRILRSLEFDALSRAEPLSDEAVCSMWLEARSILPRTLESAVIGEFRLLDVRETALGPLPALAFEWRQRPLWARDHGGDRAVLVWALHPSRVYHVYHHCCGDRWEDYRTELRRILDSFELLDMTSEGGES